MGLAFNAFLTGAFFCVALLFAAVGQAGATGYLAVMGWAGMDPPIMRPVALALNVTVALIGTLQFARAGKLSWRTFYPFGILGFPFSFLGGLLALPHHLYFPLVGVLLALASVQLGRSAIGGDIAAPRTEAEPPFFLALVAGAFVGFVSGLTGTGGGVFLAPILFLTGWVPPARAAAVTAAYNLLNSAAALLGIASAAPALPHDLPVWLLAVALGGGLGSFVAARHLPERALRAVLALVLAASAAKFLAG
jgi:uncharacterized protein